MTPHARSQSAGDWLQDLALPGVGEAAAPLARSYSGGAGGVLLLGGDIGALGVARSLGRRGIPVHFLPGPNPVAGFSRYAKTVAQWPGAEAEGAPAWLENYANANGAEGWVLIPGGDSEVRLVTGNHARLNRFYRVTTPPWDVTRFAADKSLTYARAEDLGIGHPRTWRLASRAAAEQADLVFPLILKPAMKEGVNALTTVKAWRADDRGELLALFDAAHRLAGAGGAHRAGIDPR